MHPYIHAKKNPNKPALIMASSGEITTYKELDERSNQIAHLFRQKGLKIGDGISIFMENNSRFLEICWAAQRSGLYFTPISSKLTAAEVKYIHDDCNSQFLISSKYLNFVTVSNYVSSIFLFLFWFLIKSFILWYDCGPITISI